MREPAVGGRPGVRIVLEDSFQPFVEVTCDAALSYALLNQASILRVRGDFDRARPVLDEGEERFLAAGDERGRADVLVRRAYLHLAEGDSSAARSCLDQALDYRRRTNDRRGVGLVLNGLGMIDTDAGAYRDAERLLDEARGLFRRAGDRWGLIIALCAPPTSRSPATGRTLQSLPSPKPKPWCARPTSRAGMPTCSPRWPRSSSSRAGQIGPPSSSPRHATATRRTPTQTASRPSRIGFAALLSSR